MDVPDKQAGLEINLKSPAALIGSMIPSRLMHHLQQADYDREL